MTMAANSAQTRGEPRAHAVNGCFGRVAGRRGAWVVDAGLPSSGPSVRLSVFCHAAGVSLEINDRPEHQQAG